MFIRECCTKVIHLEVHSKEADSIEALFVKLEVPWILRNSVSKHLAFEFGPIVADESRSMIPPELIKKCYRTERGESRIHGVSNLRC